jgi:hypothetical protein
MARLLPTEREIGARFSGFDRELALISVLTSGDVWAEHLMRNTLLGDRASRSLLASEHVGRGEVSEFIFEDVATREEIRVGASTFEEEFSWIEYEASDVSEAEVARVLRERYRRASVGYYYRRAVSALAGETFLSKEEAVERVVARVISRMWLDESDRMRRRVRRDAARRERLRRPSR